MVCAWCAWCGHGRAWSVHGCDDMCMCMCMYVHGMCICAPRGPHRASGEASRKRWAARRARRATARQARGSARRAGAGRAGGLRAGCPRSARAARSGSAAPAPREADRHVQCQPWRRGRCRGRPVATTRWRRRQLSRRAPAATGEGPTHSCARDALTMRRRARCRGNEFDVQENSRCRKPLFVQPSGVRRLYTITREGAAHARPLPLPSVSRPRYSRLSVSILMRSPSLMNCGTEIM